MTAYSLQKWKFFKRCPNAKAIAAGLKDIPAHWSLTPLQEKSPKRDNWQTEPFIPHSTIAELILHGEQKVSKKGKTYTAYWSGFGLRTGEASGGLLAIDVDGSSAQPLLDAISSGDIPLTPSWSSGKEGRYQLLFQMPDNIRAQLKDFNRAVLTEWGNLQTARDENGKPTELLEFRYNRSQSCLPPSRHPTTGAYHWINSPADVPVAIAPQWLCELLLSLATQTKEKSEGKQKLERERFDQRQVRRQNHRETEDSQTLVGFLKSSVLPRLSAEQIYNWEGHNFQYLGKTLKGAPPWRASASGTSFHVWWDGEQWAWQDKALGDGGGAIQYRWKLRGGYGTPRGKDFADIVAELAADAGLQLPDRRRTVEIEPDSELYAEYVDELEEEERVARSAASSSASLSQYQEHQQELKVGIGRWLGQTIKGVLKQAKGFGKKTVTRRKEKVPPSIIRYPQNSLPRPEDYEGRDLPRIIFEKGKRLEVLAKLKELGWQFICDKSFTGSGKSHDAGRLYPDPDGSNKLWYLDLNHTNPSTEPIEGMTNMPPRHNGMAQIPGKFTPKGNPHLKWAKEDEIPITPSLCHNAELFVKLKSKGWNVDSEQDNTSAEDGKSLTRNPICKQCRFAHKCHEEIGEGYGYLAARREVMESRRIRASIDSAPSPEGEKGYDYSRDTAFVEEASRYLRGTQSLSGWGDELAQLWGYVERTAPEAFAALQHIRFALQDALNGDFDCVEKGKNRGADHETLVNELPRPDAIENLPSLLQQVRQAMPSIQDVVEEPDSVTGLGGAYRKIGQFARDMMKSQAAHQTKQNIEALPPNVLVDALEVWAGIKPGSLRVAHKQLQVTIQDSRHADILSACGFVVLLDATPNIQYLEQILGDRILEIEEERPPLSNLTVVNVNMKGLGSNQVSASCKARQLALLDWITQQHREVRVLANKGDEHLPLNGWWFNDNRGSNAFKGIEALAAFNTPRPNLGVIQDEYRALFGGLEGFETYYQDLIEAEIVQTIGRQRVHQYPEAQFSLYLISTSQDLSYLTDLGCRVEDKEAVELTPLAGTPDQITRWKIFQAVGQLESQGLKITQDAIALLIGKSQGLISKIAKEFGDWKAFKKLLLVLLGLYRGSNNFSELNENEKSLIQEYLSPVVDVSVAAIATDQTPEELETTIEEMNSAILHCISELGFPKFCSGVRGLPPLTKANLLSIILRGFPSL